MSEVKRKVDEYIDYINKLEVEVWVRRKKKSNTNELNKNKAIKNNIDEFEIFTMHHKVIQSKYVKVGFLGFTVSLRSLYNLCNQLLSENICEYVLPYKISQDHIEMLFTLIRDINGYCNNPTSVPFISAYKKLLSNNMNVLVSAFANCRPEDKTLLICAETNDVDLDKVVRKIMSKKMS